MALSWTEIKERALRFANEWKDDSSEDAEAKSFWDDFSSKCIRILTVPWINATVRRYF